MARSAQDVDTGFWVLQNGRWSDLTARADADHVTDEVTVTLVDGGAGDEDRRADGVIADPGGPGCARDDWSLTITLQASADPTATFNFFLEECTETSGTTACTPQDPRQWVDWVAVDGPTLPGTAITPVTLSDGQSFTWANLDADRHYRMIEVGTASPPDTGTGSPPPGWAVTGFACESVGATLLESDDNYFVGYLSAIDEELVPGPGWSDCTVANSQIAEARAGSTITAHKVGDRSAIRTNQPLQGATMGLWRDLNGDGNFQPGGADGAAFTTCVTGANWSMRLRRIWRRVPTGSRRCRRPPVGPGMPSSTGVRARAQRRTIAVPYAAVRNGDPAATLSVRWSNDYTNGFPIIVDGRTSDRRSTDDFANRRTNPSIGDVTCQALFRIVLVLDRSGSIQTNGAAAYKNAVTGFVNDLVGTNTEVGIVSFAASSSLEAGYTSVLGGPSAALLNAINNVYNNTGGGTNWDAGLFAVNGPFIAGSGPRRHGHGRQPHPEQHDEHLGIRGELARLHPGRDLRQPAQEQRLAGHHRRCRSGGLHLHPWPRRHQRPADQPAQRARRRLHHRDAR